MRSSQKNYYEKTVKIIFYTVFCRQNKNTSFVGGFWGVGGWKHVIQLKGKQNYINDVRMFNYVAVEIQVFCARVQRYFNENTHRVVIYKISIKFPEFQLDFIGWGWFSRLFGFVCCFLCNFLIFLILMGNWFFGI